MARMPEKKTLERARRKQRQGKRPTTVAGEFVREEMEHVRKGKHPVKSRKQAIAIGLSKARKSGVKLPPQRNKRTAAKSKTRRSSTAAKKSGGRKTRSRR
jgi:hypothetical protein